MNEVKHVVPTTLDGVPTIVVLDKGFVYAGIVYDDGGPFIEIQNTVNIRRFGTTAGLGELGLKGPTSETQLDPVPTLLAPRHALVSYMVMTPQASDGFFKKEEKKGKK